MRHEAAHHQLVASTMTNKETNDARSCSLRPRRCAVRGSRQPANHRADGCGRQDLGPPACAGRTSSVEEVGSAVKSVKPGQFVIGSFFASDNTCPGSSSFFRARSKSCVPASPERERSRRSHGETSPERPVLVTLEAAERDHILRALREANGVIGGSAGAAARLGMKRTTLQSRMTKLGISRHL